MKKCLKITILLWLLLFCGCMSHKIYSKEEAILNLQNIIESKNNPIGFNDLYLRNKLSENMTYIHKHHKDDIKYAFNNYTVFFEDKDTLKIIVLYRNIHDPTDIDSFYYTFTIKNKAYSLEDIEFAD